MHIAHHPIFVALSMVVACLGSWTALDLFRRVRAHAGVWRGGWLLATAMAMGLSIWSMHFIAMLGFDPGAEVRYRVDLTLLSLLLAIAATAFAFFTAAERSAARLVVGGLVMGAGICIMHYVGMAAVITPADLQNEPAYVVLAFLIAVTASTGALVAATHERTFSQRALAAVVLGFAIVGMHYTAMAGIRLHPGAVAAVAGRGVDSIVLAVGVAAGTSLILFLALIAALSDRRIEALAAQEARQALELRERIAAALAEKAEAEAALMHVQRLESLGRLTGGVAHDFNNLLTVIIGALDIILRRPENAERRVRLGEAALAAAKRGERLTAQLLAFARRQPLRPQACDMNDLIRESELLLRGAAGERLTLDLELCETPAVALIDPAQFEATLLNLVVNAVDASPAGGTICVQTRVREMSGHERKELAPGRYFCMCVSDTGQGMTPEVMSRIFEPFFTTKPAGKGTGLGLSQVYGFVRQSGGDVRVQSAAGQGTLFTVYLPVLEHALREAPQQKPVAGETCRELNVLLAEDDSSVAVVTETMLKDLGHRVVRAQNAQEALHVLRSAEPIDLLLSDVVMPGGLNGVELAQRATALRPALKVLLTSGYAAEAVDELLARHAWPLLKKPYLEDELASRLGKLFEAGESQIPESG